MIQYVSVHCGLPSLLIWYCAYAGKLSISWYLYPRTAICSIYLSRFLGHSKGVLAQCAPFRVLTVQGSLRRPTRHVFKNGPLVPNHENKQWDVHGLSFLYRRGLVEQVVFSLKHLHRQFEAGGTLHWYSLVLVAWSWLKSLQSQCTSFKEAAEDLTHASQGENCSETDPNSKCVANVRLWIFQDECVAIEATVFLMLRRCLPQTQLWTRALQCTASINSWWHLSAGAMAYPNLDGQNPAALGMMKAWFFMT